MHQPIRENLEEYLSGMEDAGIVHEIEAHLASCEQCRRVMEQMRRQSELLKVLHPRTETEPAPGFYARVIDRIEALRPVSVWSIFLEPGFSRKIDGISSGKQLNAGDLVEHGIRTWHCVERYRQRRVSHERGGPRLRR